MPDAPQWDGKLHKSVKFGDSFDPRSVEGRKRAARRAAQSSTRKGRRVGDKPDLTRVGEELATVLPELLNERIDLLS
jgi:hypothetical protein